MSSERDGYQFGGASGAGTIENAATANRDLIDAIDNIRLRRDDVDVSLFLKTLIDKTSRLPPSDRDAILNKVLLNLLIETEEIDVVSQEAIEECIDRFSEADFRALGYSKLAQRVKSRESSDRLADLAWNEVEISRERPSWYASAFRFSWPILALALGFVATNAFSAFFKVVGEHIAKAWVGHSKAGKAESDSSQRAQSDVKPTAKES